MSTVNLYVSKSKSDQKTIFQTVSRSSSLLAGDLHEKMVLAPKATDAADIQQLNSTVEFQHV